MSIEIAWGIYFVEHAIDYICYEKEKEITTVGCYARVHVYNTYPWQNLIRGLLKGPTLTLNPNSTQHVGDELRRLVNGVIVYHFWLPRSKYYTENIRTQMKALPYGLYPLIFYYVNKL